MCPSVAKEAFDVESLGSLVKTIGEQGNKG